MNLGKRMDEQQSEMLSELRNDFARTVAKLDNSQVIKDLEEVFARKIKNLEQALLDSERNLTATFEGLIRQADLQINKSITEAMKS